MVDVNNILEDYTLNPENLSNSIPNNFKCFLELNGNSNYTPARKQSLKIIIVGKTPDYKI